MHRDATHLRRRDARLLSTVRTWLTRGGEPADDEEMMARLADYTERLTALRGRLERYRELDREQRAPRTSRLRGASGHGRRSRPLCRTCERTRVVVEESREILNT